MAKIKLNGDTSGYIEISAPAVSGNNTLELGPGTKILTNLDNTFTGVSTFSSDVYLGNDIYLTDDSSGYEKVEVGVNDIRVESKHVHSEFGVWTRSNSIGDRRNGMDGDGSDLRLYSNSTEKVRITSGGKVGIRTDNPKQIFSVVGRANFDLQGDYYGSWINGDSQGSSSFNVGAWHNVGGRMRNEGSHLVLETMNTSHWIQLQPSGGNISVGSNNPNGLLALTAASGRLLTLRNSTTGSGSGDGSYLALNGSDLQIANAESANLILYTADTERLRITSAGDVGIGENSPADRLVVQEANASGDVAVRIKNDTTTDGSASTPTTASLYLNTSTGDFNTFYIQARRYDNDTHFGYSNPRDGGHTPNMIISNEGHITKPNQPRFFAYGTNSINKTTTGYHTWETFTNTRFNVGNDFSTSTKLFTAPVSGTYLFGCNCRIDQGGVGYFRIILSINGSSADNDQGHSIRNADAANAFYHSQEITALYQLNANDNVRVIVEANSDSSWQMQSESQFWGYLVA